MEAARRRAQIEVERLTVVDDALSAITGAGEERSAGNLKEEKEDG